MGAALECTMTEWGDAGAGAADSLSSKASTRACGGRACGAARAIKLFIVGASLTESAGAPGVGCMGAGEPFVPLGPPTVRSTPPLAYANNSSALISLSGKKCDFYEWIIRNIQYLKKMLVKFLFFGGSIIIYLLYLNNI